jgi:hypothetical protein
MREVMTYQNLFGITNPPRQIPHVSIGFDDVACEVDAEPTKIEHH